MHLGSRNYSIGPGLELGILALVISNPCMYNEVMFTTFELSWMIGAGVIAILLLILVVSFASRAKVFCQYLRTMSGIELKPREVRHAFRVRGKEGVRELFLDLIIREEAKGPAVTPDSKPQKPILEVIGREG